MQESFKKVFEQNENEQSCIRNNVIWSRAATFFAVAEYQWDIYEQKLGTTSTYLKACGNPNIRGLEMHGLLNQILRAMPLVLRFRSLWIEFLASLDVVISGYILLAWKSHIIN